MFCPLIWLWMYWKEQCRFVRCLNDVIVLLNIVIDSFIKKSSTYLRNPKLEMAKHVPKTRLEVIFYLLDWQMFNGKILKVLTKYLMLSLYWNQLNRMMIFNWMELIICLQSQLLTFLYSIQFLAWNVICSNDYSHSHK